MKATKFTVGFALLMASGFTTSVLAQSVPGQAEVRAIRGQAVYTTDSQAATPLKVGTVLPAGSTIKTALASSVDLFLGNSAGVVRVTENTTLALDKMTITDTGADTVVEVQLNLPEGTILGNVNKLSAASKYEIKLPNGVAGIRGTRFRISSTAFVVLLEGTLIFVHAPPGGPLTPHTLNAPPAAYFSPLQGVMPAPPDLVTEVQNQFSDRPVPQIGGVQPPPRPDRPLDSDIDEPGQPQVDSTIPNYTGGLIDDEGNVNEDLADELDINIDDILSENLP